MSNHLIQDVNEFLLHSNDRDIDSTTLLKRALSALEAAHELLAMERAAKERIIEKIMLAYLDIMAPTTILPIESLTRLRDDWNTVNHRPPNEDNTTSDIIRKHFYPAPPEEHHENPKPCDTPGRYTTTPNNVWDGEGP